MKRLFIKINKYFPFYDICHKLEQEVTEGAIGGEGIIKSNLFDYVLRYKVYSIFWINFHLFYLHYNETVIYEN